MASHDDEESKLSASLGSLREQEQDYIRSDGTRYRQRFRIIRKYVDDPVIHHETEHYDEDGSLKCVRLHYQSGHVETIEFAPGQARNINDIPLWSYARQIMVEVEEEEEEEDPT